MKEKELIVKQALEIEELKEENALLKKIVSSVHSQLFNIGAPLNDNVDGYTEKQLKTFFRIEKILRGDFDF